MNYDVRSTAPLNMVVEDSALMVEKCTQLFHEIGYDSEDADLHHIFPLFM